MSPKDHNQLHDEKGEVELLRQELRRMQSFFETRIRALEQEIANLRHDNGNLRQENVNLRQENGNLRREIGNLRQENGNLRQENLNLRTENADLSILFKNEDPKSPLSTEEGFAMAMQITKGKQDLKKRNFSFPFQLFYYKCSVHPPLFKGLSYWPLFNNPEHAETSNEIIIF
jgi:regulator of replication initiation timing